MLTKEMVIFYNLSLIFIYMAFIVLYILKYNRVQTNTKDIEY